MEDVAYLVSEQYINTDSEGNIIHRRKASPILCKVKSVTRREFYDAATQDIEPEIEMTISHRIDYNDQKLVLYKDILYDVVRTYWKSDEVSLTLAKNIGTEDEQEAVLIMPNGESVTFANGERLTINY